MEAAKVNKDDDGKVNKGDSKQAKPKPKQVTHSSKKKKKDSSAKRIKPPDDNLDEYFGLNQGQNSQETVVVTPMETPKKSEEAKSKNFPDGSSCRRGDRSPSLELKQSARHAEGSSHGKVHRSPWGSAHEGSPGPSSESKQSAQQATKPESEDSSSLSSSSRYSESSDEKVPSKGKMKELPPPPPLKKKHRSQSPPHSRGKCSKSQSRPCTLKWKNDR